MKTVYVSKTNKTTVICPSCRFTKKIDVTNFKNTQKKRKKVRLHGEYFVQERDEKGEIIIEDISASGIRFASLKPHYISRSDTVELKFTLDNPMRTEINKLVKIIWIIDRNVGVQYIDPKSLEKELGFYLGI